MTDLNNLIYSHSKSFYDGEDSVPDTIAIFLISDEDKDSLKSKTFHCIFFVKI